MAPADANGCPGTEALERYAAALPTDRLVVEHVATCASCHDRVTRLRDDNALIAEFVSANSEVLAARNRKRIIADAIPGYRILSTIRQGGQGVVYKAVQLTTKRTVALKLLTGGAFATTRQRGRFEREIELVAGLRHPNIVTIFDSGATPDGRPYFAMEYVDGVPVDEHVEQTRTRAGGVPAIEEILKLFARICDAVHFAHQRGIVHRDLKPSNLLVDATGEPRVLDFGLAKVSGSESLISPAVTLTGEFMGTFAYASPEQTSGRPDEIDIRTDVYSLGMILYEMLAGRRPYILSGSVNEAIATIKGSEPACPSVYNADLDEELDTIALKALAKEPDRRYQSAGDLLADIERYQAGDAIDAKRDSTWYVLQKTIRRHRAAVALTSVSAVALLVFSIFMSLAYRRASSAEQAETQRSAELTDSLAASNIERGRLMSSTSNVPAAERLLWREFLTHTNDSLLGRQAYWGLWELYSQHPCLATISGRSQTLNQNPFMSSGTQVQRLCIDGAIEQWNLPALIQTIVHEPPAFERGAWSWASRGGGVIAGLRDGEAFLWEPRGHRPPWPIQDKSVHTSEMLYFALSPDGALLARPDATGQVHFYDTATGALVAAHENSLCIAAGSGAMAFSPDGSGLIIPGSNSRIEYWSVSDHAAQPKWSFDAKRPLNNARAISPDQRHVVCSDQEHTILVLDAASGQLLFDLKGHTGHVRAFAFSPDGTRLASGGWDKSIRIWDLPHRVQSMVLVGNTDVVSAIQFSTSLDLLYSASCYDTLKAWDINPNPAVRLADQQSTIMAARFSPDGHSLLCTDGVSGRIWTYDLQGHKPGQSIAAHKECVSGLAISLDGSTLASTGYDGFVRLWDRATNRQLAEINVSPKARLLLSDVAWSPDGRTVAAAGSDQCIYLWDRDGRMPLRTLHGHSQRVATVAFSPDGRTLASGGADGLLIVWNATTGEVVRKIPAHGALVRAITFSPDGRCLVSCGDDNTVRIWDAASERCLHTLEGHQQDVFTVCVSPDGKMIASGDRCGVIMLWDLQGGVNLAKISRHTDMVFTVAFSPDGRHLVSGGRDRTVLIHDLSYFDRHIAGNAEAQISRLDKENPAPQLVADRRQWAREIWQTRWEDGRHKSANHK